MSRSAFRLPNEMWLLVSELADVSSAALAGTCRRLRDLLHNRFLSCYVDRWSTSRHTQRLVQSAHRVRVLRLDFDWRCLEAAEFACRALALCPCVESLALTLPPETAVMALLRMQHHGCDARVGDNASGREHRSRHLSTLSQFIIARKQCVRLRCRSVAYFDRLVNPMQVWVFFWGGSFSSSDSSPRLLDRS